MGQRQYGNLLSTDPIEELYDELLDAINYTRGSDLPVEVRERLGVELVTMAHVVKLYWRLMRSHGREWEPGPWDWNRKPWKHPNPVVVEFGKSSPESK